MLCRLAEHYGGWPHEIARFPFHYYMAIRQEYLAEMKARADALKPEPDEDTIEM